MLKEVMPYATKPPLYSTKYNNFNNMKRYYKLIMMMVCLFGTLSFSSCKDDEDSNEWNATYVSLQRIDHLQTIKSFSLSHHILKGISGDDVTTTFAAVLNKPSSSDVIVSLNIKAATTSGEEIPTENLQVSSRQVTIKAGETKSEEVTVAIPDWTFALNRAEATTYNIEASIESIEAKGNTLIAKNSDLNKIKLPVYKGTRLNLEETTAPEYDRIDRKDWIMALGGSPRGGSDPYNLIDDSYSDVASDGGLFWFTADMGEPKELGVIMLQYYGTGYGIQQVEILTSDSGASWSSAGILTLERKNPNYIKFIEPVKTRFVKVNIVSKRSNTVSVIEFETYEVAAK